MDKFEPKKNKNKNSGLITVSLLFFVLAFISFYLSRRACTMDNQIFCGMDYVIAFMFFFGFGFLFMIIHFVNKFSRDK